VSGRRRVLVVDDDTVSRLVLGHMVTRLGHEVVQAEDVDVALAASGGVDLVLCDYCLPGGTGVELLARLRASGVDAPFVLVTGVAEVAAGAEAPGVADRLTKPVDSRRLATCLAGVLGPPG
jgi:two-component system, chemotaxis family, chemotaxis protein CheY